LESKIDGEIKETFMGALKLKLSWEEKNLRKIPENFQSIKTMKNLD
jgi:hypothetical protein